jgi:hypothetical protein
MSLANLELVIHAQIFTSQGYLMRFFCLFQQAGLFCVLDIFDKLGYNSTR